MIRRFRIICLKRSQFKESNNFDYTTDWYKDSKVVYWKDDFSGYTQDIEEAGEYTIQQLQQVNGKWMDWLLEPSWR